MKKDAADKEAEGSISGSGKNRVWDGSGVGVSEKPVLESASWRFRLWAAS